MMVVIVLIISDLQLMDIIKTTDKFTEEEIKGIKKSCDGMCLFLK